MRIFGLSSCLLALALAGCGPGALPGGAGEAPSAGELLAASVEALAAQPDPSARFRLEAEARPEGGPAGLLLRDGVSLELEGVVSARAFTASGKVEGNGETFEGELRLGERGAFVRVGDRWYGTTQSSRGEGVLRFEPPAGVSAAELAAALRAAGDELVDGEVGSGPTVDGDRTWELRGTIDPAAAAEVARALGRPLPPEAARELGEQAGDLRFAYAAGRDDGLPRRIAVKGAIAAGTLLGDAPVDRVVLDLDIELTDWGAPVHVEAPAGYTSFEELFSSFLGFGGGAPALPDLPVPGPPPEVELPAPSAPPPPPAVEIAPPPEVAVPVPPEVSAPLPPEVVAPQPIVTP